MAATPEIKLSTSPALSWAAQARKWWEELFGSRYARALERQLIETRLDCQRQITALQQEKAQLTQRIRELEERLIPGLTQRKTAMAPSAPPLSKFQQIVEAQLKANQALDAEEQNKTRAKEN